MTPGGRKWRPGDPPTSPANEAEKADDRDDGRSADLDGLAGRNDFADLDESVSIRGEYERLGSDGYYRRHGHAYRNPHEPIVARALRLAVDRWRPDLSRVLDLAAGSGEATLALRSLGAAAVDGVDPYTADAYERRVGTPAERLTFEQVAAGALAGRAYSLVVCSFAMHLVEPSRLPRLATQLAPLAPRLWIVTPHKRPLLQAAWGWTLEAEMVVERVRVREYRSALAAGATSAAAFKEPRP